MRLYRLIARIGQRKRSLHPWFAPPAAGAPMRYYGWHWDPALGEWIKHAEEPIQIKYRPSPGPMPTEPPTPAQTADVPGWEWDSVADDWIERPMPTETIAVGEPRPPMPAGPPRPAQPSNVPGWRWSEQYEIWEQVPLTRKEGAEGIEPWPMPQYPPGPAVPSVQVGWTWWRAGQEWTATGMPVKLVEVEVERPPKPQYSPGVGGPTEVLGWKWYETEQEWAAIIYGEKVMDFQMPETLSPAVTLAMVEGIYPYAEIAQKATEMLIHGGYNPEQARQYGITVIEMVRNLTMAASREGQQARVEKAVTVFQEFEPGMGAKYMMPVILYIIMVLTGWTIGRIMARLVWPEEEFFVLTEPDGTYLMGPDEWFYSRNIGASPMGNLYYSKCEGIGTEYVRHKRGSRGSLYDVIDFPGGFVEEGYVFPWFVKYTWSHWNIVYIGMLFSSSELVFALKKEFISLEERARPVTLRPAGEWCTGFHHYL